MKNMIKRFGLLAIAACLCMAASAQQVATTAMLYTAPYRHFTNPSWEPITDGYFYIPALSHMGFWAGNNSLAMSDIFIFKDGKTMWTLNPESGVNPLKSFRKNTLISADVNITLLGFGFRLKNDGYLHVNLNERIDAGVALPKDLFNFALGGGMTNLEGINNYNLTSLGLRAQMYTELGVGYSHSELDGKITWGLKVKFLAGHAYAGMKNKDLQLNASIDEWQVKGNGQLMMALPVDNYPVTANYDDMVENYSWSDSLHTDDVVRLVKNVLNPSGYGAAFDLGFTYKPIDQLQLSLSLTDIGAIYWHRGMKYNYTLDGTFDGVGEIRYGDYKNEKGEFDTERLKDTVVARLETVYKEALTSEEGKKGFFAPLTMKLNAGIDANFCDDIIGLGLYSKTMLFNSKLYEELTFGFAVRPASWINMGVSYSFLNGKWSNVGAGLALRGGPFVLTVAADYIPGYYAPIPDGDKSTAPTGYYIPYKTKGLNAELGLAVVWGWKKKDSDKDGVYDKLDMCPKTPKGVQVDELGCPLDSDGDGVPDYLDNCPGTPAAAYGLTDSLGCPIDTDGDGVPDYLDLCPQTPQEAFGKIDENGCPLDSDGDGVPDYLDQCPNTPAEAQGYIDEHGCPIDSDGDGVPDYIDQCPNTPAEAFGYLDSVGCPLDTDGDGVPDYIDECPNTPAEAQGFVDEKGCLLDTDGDGVPDYLDQCPTVAGTKKNNGCPEVKREIRNLLKKAMQGIQFETGKAVIKKQSYGILDQIATVFLENPEYIVEVQGHTDNVGKPDYNLKLSDNRAKAVREYLIGKGVAAERLTAKGYGDTVPIADNKTSKGRALNRRVEFDITFEEVTYETIELTPEQVAAQQAAENAK